MIARRVAALVALAAALGACQAASSGLLPDRLAGVDWIKHLARCPVGESRGYGMKIDDLIKAEVTGDRYPDTLIVDSCDSPTASNPQTVEVFDGASEPAAPRRIGILMERDPDYPRWMKLRIDPDRSIVIEAKGLQPDSPRCCPDLLIVIRFVWREGAFTTVSRTTTPS